MLEVSNQRLHLIAHSFAIDRHNKGYIKFSTTDIEANSQILKKIYLHGYSYPEIEISTEDHDRANEFVHFMSRYLTKVINNSESFEAKIYYSTFTSNEIDTFKLEYGLISFIPEFYRKELVKKENKQRVKNCRNNVIPEKVNQTIELRDIYIFSKKYNIDYNKYNYRAIHENRMISFFHATNFEESQSISIRGKIKAKNKSWLDDQVIETRLNYVKVIS